MSQASPRSRSRGLPIAAHVALLVTLALLASYAVNIAVIAALPPRPPGVTPHRVVFDEFARAYDAAVAARPLPKPDFGDFRIEAAKPRVNARPPFARDFAATLAARLGRSAEQVVISVDRPPGDVVVYRVNREFAERPPHPHGFDPDDRARPNRPMPPRPPFPPPPGAAPPAPPPEPFPRFEGPQRGVFFLARFMIGAQLPDGRWLVLRQRQTRDDLAWIATASLAIGASFAIALTLALVFARVFAAPIRRFAEAAQRVGVDPKGAPAPEEGPRELQVAARAVNAMQSRLRGLVADRTQMLAAVAHDLRTPLMRMRLAAETAEPALRDALARDAEEIDALVASFIAFARDDPSQDARVRLDIAALAQSIADDRAAAGDRATYHGPDRVVILGQPLGLKRMLANLVDNALRHGGSARVSLSESGGAVDIAIADDGPGIPADRRDDVFQPFVRLNPDSAAGAGLGLAVVQSVVRAHGGTVAIDDAPGGGAVVRVRLPL